uniref:Uncharacterized protein n=1 Tax=Rousettus aegyptiacus TaxID=9407 RepID=A0A7J8KAQ6_ROUAE|nr:hypothetical protein HJG63_007815 [Rousettus aegyptiacus]
MESRIPTLPFPRCEILPAFLLLQSSFIHFPNIDGTLPLCQARTARSNCRVPMGQLRAQGSRMATPTMPTARGPSLRRTSTGSSSSSSPSPWKRTSMSCRCLMAHPNQRTCEPGSQAFSCQPPLSAWPPPSLCASSVTTRSVLRASMPAMKCSPVTRVGTPDGCPMASSRAQPSTWATRSVTAATLASSWRAMPCSPATLARRTVPRGTSPCPPAEVGGQRESYRGVATGRGCQSFQ